MRFQLFFCICTYFCKSAAHLGALLVAHDLNGSRGSLRSGISRGWLECSFLLCPSARGGADTCSLCCCSSMQKVGKNIWCVEQTGEANTAHCLYIIISGRQLAPHIKQKWKLPADLTGSFVCATSTCWQVSATVLLPRSSEFICLQFGRK